MVEHPWHCTLNGPRSWARKGQCGCHGTASMPWTHLWWRLRRTPFPAVISVGLSVLTQSSFHHHFQLSLVTLPAAIPLCQKPRWVKRVQKGYRWQFWPEHRATMCPIATANVSAELHSFWQAPGFLMGAAGVIWGLCHPDTFIFGHLAPSHYHTTYQLYLCISVVSLGVSREFYKGLACGADRRLFPYFLGQRQTLLVLFFHCCIQLGFILLVEVVGFYGISYVSLAYNLQ